MLTFNTVNPGDEFPTRERCGILELLNGKEVEDLSIARCRVEPGVTTELHSLAGVREVYIVVSGGGVMDDGRGEGDRVGPMDSVVIPPGYPQRIHNDGAEDLVFLAICTPRFVPDAYTPHEGEGACDPDYGADPEAG